MTNATEEFYDDGEEVIAEVRAARHRISARFGHDPYRLVAYLMEQQRQRGGRLIPAPAPERTDPAA